MTRGELARLRAALDAMELHRWHEFGTAGTEMGEIQVVVFALSF
jgi:hypothetical protein